MIIALTGFMGAGKSCVGEALAKSLGWDFVDLDRYIEHKAGCSIAEIFSSRGEEYFRALESEAARDLVVMHRITHSDCVIALGGGTFSLGPVRELLLDQTRTVYLKVAEDTLATRLEESDSRRPLMDSADWRTLLHCRIPDYEKAEFTVEYDELPIDGICREIESLLISA